MYSIRGKRILIIDDDEDINNLFTIFLEYDGYKNRCFLLILLILCTLLEKIFRAKSILDNLSCNIPSSDEKWGNSIKETFEYYSTHYDQLDLNHILRDHYPQPITS
jgi:hypothetical protein